MRIPSGAADWSHARTSGRYLDSLTSNHDWILRRVDSIRFVDSTRVERRITFDIDVDDVRRRARSANLLDPVVPLPLMTLVKAPILDVDITGVGGESIAIATSDQDSHLASSLLLATLSRHGIRPRRLPPEVLWQLYSVVRDRSIDRLVQLLYAVDPGAFDDPPVDKPLRLRRIEGESWDRMLDVDEFLNSLIDYAGSFMLVAQLDVGQQHDVAILKVRLLEDRNTGEDQTSWLSPDRLGWRPLTLKVPMGGLGNAQRNHVRVFAPEESVIRHARLADDELELEDVRNGVKPDGSIAPLDRASFYGNDVRRSSYEMTVEVEPARGPFLIPAAITTGLLTFLLWAAAFLQSTDSRFSDHPTSFAGSMLAPGVWEITSIAGNQANFDAAVTVLAIAPSLVAIYLVRAGEHRLVTRLMVVPRVLVLLSALATIVAAGATAASIEPGRLTIVYVAAATMSTIALIAVVIPLARINAFRTVRSLRTYRKRRMPWTRAS